MINGLRIFFVAGVLAVGFFARANATELYFQPDTTAGVIGDTVNLSAWITSSETVRGFTVYLEYDTNLVDLVPAPTPGALIAGLTGLDFRYADHIVSAPDWLEVGATIFGTSFWAGPGELFHLKMVFRGCGDVSMTASFGMRRPDGSFIPGDFNPPAFLICDRVPQSPDSLTIFWTGTAAQLRWKAVTQDTLNRVLLVSPLYRILRSEQMPLELPYTVIDSTFSTSYLDTSVTSDEQLYEIEAVGQ